MKLHLYKFTENYYHSFVPKGGTHRLARAHPGHGELKKTLDAWHDRGDDADDDLAAVRVAGQLQVLYILGKKVF